MIVTHVRNEGEEKRRRTEREAGCDILRIPDGFGEFWTLGVEGRRTSVVDTAQGGKEGGARGDGAAGINDKRTVESWPFVCARACVPLLVAKEGSGDREGGRDGGGCVVYRYSHGRVFAAIFGPFPFAARGAFTVHTSYPNPAVHLLVTPSFDRRHPRVMDTQGVGDYANEAARPFWRIASRWARRVAKLVCRFLFEPITL